MDHFPYHIRQMKIDEDAAEIAALIRVCFRPWLDERLPGHGVVFVAPPAMRNQDEPEQDSLPRFEQDLAAALTAALTAPQPAPETIAALSWDGLCRTLLPLL